MNVRNSLYHGDTLSMTTSRTKKPWHEPKPCHKSYKFDLEVKGQHRIRIMNVLDTFSHGDRPMCQIWYRYANIKANRSYTGQT